MQRPALRTHHGIWGNNWGTALYPGEASYFRKSLKMKKLLALILCVMLFVSVIPTAAFAADVGVGDESGWAASKINTKAVSNMKDDIASMYAALAVNQTVFGTAKVMHDLADGMVKALFADTDSIDFLNPDGTVNHTVAHDDLVTNARAYLKEIIGGHINSYIAKRLPAMTDDDGNVDAEDYLKLYTKAVSDALTSSKAQKGFEAFVYAIVTANLADSINDQFDDLYDAMVDWNDFGNKWGEFGFAGEVPDFSNLWHNIPTTANAADPDDATYLAVWAALS